MSWKTELIETLDHISLVAISSTIGHVNALRFQNEGVYSNQWISGFLLHGYFKRIVDIQFNSLF